MSIKIRDAAYEKCTGNSDMRCCNSFQALHGGEWSQSVLAWKLSGELVAIDCDDASEAAGKQYLAERDTVTV